MMLAISLVLFTLLANPLKAAGPPQPAVAAVAAPAPLPGNCVFLCNFAGTSFTWAQIVAGHE